jgi:prolyl-tRNA synthetase
MKDAYSFDVDDDAASKSYEIMRDAYYRVFERCGLDFRAVEADSGSIGGSYSHEFMVLADTGEDTLVTCKSCSYAANVEKAAIAPPAEEAVIVQDLPQMEKVATPGTKKVDRVAELLQISAKDIVKTMFYLADDVVVAALVRGDRVVQSVKLKNLLDADDVEPVAEEEVWSRTKLPAGYLGPVGLEMKVVADHEIMGMASCVTGANEKGHHLQGVVPGRDFTPDIVGDLRQITTEDNCPLCGGALGLTEGIEVGHIFKLGTGYSESMNATFQDNEGGKQHFVMGCYGIGVSRVVAAAIEQNHDRNGIIFPVPMAPFQVIVLNLSLKNEGTCKAAEDLYLNLKQQGYDVLYDDRDERPGSKFKDADLIGIPFRVTVGKTYEKNGEVEVLIRKDGTTAAIPYPEAAEYVGQLIQKGLT